MPASFDVPDSRHTGGMVRRTCRAMRQTMLRREDRTALLGLVHVPWDYEVRR